MGGVGEVEGPKTAAEMLWLDRDSAAALTDR